MLLMKVLRSTVLRRLGLVVIGFSSLFVALTWLLFANAYFGWIDPSDYGNADYVKGVMVFEVIIAGLIAGVTCEVAEYIYRLLTRRDLRTVVEDKIFNLWQGPTQDRDIDAREFCAAESAPILDESRNKYWPDL